MALQVITDSGNEPITLDEAKAYIKYDEVDNTTEDMIIRMMVTAAREFAESETGLSLKEKTHKMTIIGSELPNGIFRLQAPPIISITSVTKTTSGVESTLTENTDYIINGGNMLQVVSLAEVDESSTYTVNYESGYCETNIPMGLKLAVMQLVYDLYEHRGSIAVGTISSELIMTYRAKLKKYSVKSYL